MFLALIIPAFLSPSQLSLVYGREDLSVFRNFTFSQQGSLLPLQPYVFEHLKLPPVGDHRRLQNLFLPNDLSVALKNVSGSPTQVGFHQRGPGRLPETYSQDSTKVSSYRGVRDSRDVKGKSFYKSLIQKLLRRPGSRQRKGYRKYSSRPASHSYSYSHPMSAVAQSSDMGWGGWGGGGGWKGGGGHGISALDMLLTALSLLSLGGFLLNLLLNLLNMFGAGFMTSTATYPVTFTQTTTGGGGTITGGGGTNTGGGITTTGGGITVTGGTGGTGITLTGIPIFAAAQSGWGSGAGLGYSSRTLNSTAGEWKSTTQSPPGWGWERTTQRPPGWGWKRDRARLKEHQSGGSEELSIPSPNSTDDDEARSKDIPFPLRPLRQRRRKRETFLPYVDASTALNVLAKAILSAIEAVTEKYECIERVHCENNRQARVIGQWMEYFMPVYSFTVSYFGHKLGTHESLPNHIRAIVLGAAETNCQIHFPQCGHAATEIV